MVEILQGMALTLKMMFSRPVTIQYPFEHRTIFPGFRGRHAFVRDVKTNKEKCIICMKCANICPAQCIKITKGRDANNRPFLEQYDIEALRCIYCGYCVEVCPVCALVLTEQFNYVGTRRDEFLFTKERLLKNWDDFAATLPGNDYWNKFWRPDGVDISKMPKSKREQGPVLLRPLPPEPAPVAAEAVEKEAPQS
jgi:NADH-quinone oxidoreductase subunit I